MASTEAPGAGTTILIVAVPEAEQTVSLWRESHDPSAAKGVPAHITLLYPFLPTGDLRSGDSDKLRSVIVAVPRFSFTWSHVAVIPRVTWLAPEPADIFRNITRRIVRRFPSTAVAAQRQPSPHLTVIDHTETDTDYASAHDRFVAPSSGCFPIKAKMQTVLLLAKHDDAAEDRGEVRQFRLPSDSAE